MGGLYYGYVYYEKLLAPVDEQVTEQILISIPSGSSTIKIASILKENQLIKDENAFRLYTRLNKADGRMKAGEYGFSQHMSVSEIVNVLIKGTVVTYPFTIPEGYTLKQIANTLASKDLVNEEVFLDLLETGEFDFPYQDQLLEGANRYEGFLFPDTYYITSYMTEKDIIQMMLNRFVQVVNSEVVEKAAAKGLSVFELITLAAMVERESSVDADRPKITGVIFNRLKRGMLLQIDATVIYAHGEHITKVYNKHTAIDSPYNTYKYPGMPLGPIAAPGEKSIMAVLEPEEHQYLYYVLKPDGSHYFSKTLSEHEWAIKKYLQ